GQQERLLERVHRLHLRGGGGVGEPEQLPGPRLTGAPPPPQPGAPRPPERPGAVGRGARPARPRQGGRLGRGPPPRHNQAGEEGGGAAGRRERRRSVAGRRTVSAIRTVSTAGGEAAWSDAVPRPSARYPAAAIPATTTTPTTKPVRDLGFAAGGRARRALPGASGVVGAPVISVGESAVPRTRGPAALRPFLGATTGCSG